MGPTRRRPRLYLRAPMKTCTSRTSMRAPKKLNGSGSNELVTEDQAGLRFAHRHSGRLRYCHTTGKLFEWTGGIWKVNETALAFHFARELAREIAASEDDKVRYIAGKASFAGGVERLARSDPTFAVTVECWDKDPFLLGAPRGTIDLRTGMLRPSDPNDGITRSTAITPAEYANCPLWLAFLQECTNKDAGMVLFLQQWFGYCLTGDTSERLRVHSRRRRQRKGRLRQYARRHHRRLSYDRAYGDLHRKHR